MPVIVLFTKFDALLPVAMSELSGDARKLPIQEKVAKAHELMDGVFDNANVWGRLSQLNYAPKHNVRIGGIILLSNKIINWLTECALLQGMHNSNEGCDVLLEKTAGALNEEALQMLYVTAQETNIALCVRYAVQE